MILIIAGYIPGSSYFSISVVHCQKYGVNKNQILIELSSEDHTKALECIRIFWESEIPVLHFQATLQLKPPHSLFIEKCHTGEYPKKQLDKVAIRSFITN